MLLTFSLTALLLLHVVTVNAGLYVRWGRKSCEGDASVVYNGYVASAHSVNAGNGKNYLCLHATPEWGNVKAGHQLWGSPMYGAQYAIGGVEGYGNNQPFSWANFNGQDPDQFTASCVVCETPNQQVLMIPARKSCPADWYSEYSGYLVALVQMPSEWICLDGAPEPSSGGRTAWQASFHVAEVFSGALPAGTYTDGNEVSCVICSK